MRSAYDLDAPREMNWRLEARCGINPDMWHSESALGVAAARHQCLSHCPVLAECRRDAEAAPRLRRTSVVLGGVAYNKTGRESLWQPSTHSCGECA